MIHAIGVDLCTIARIKASVQKQGDAFLEQVFTAEEQTYCAAKITPEPSLAARFAAKEAVMKCLGTGWSDGIGFRQIEVVRQDSGAVSIRTHGRAAELAREIGITRIHLSLSHTDETAIAYAVAECESD